MHCEYTIWHTNEGVHVAEPLRHTQHNQGMEHTQSGRHERGHEESLVEVAVLGLPGRGSHARHQKLGRLLIAGARWPQCALLLVTMPTAVMPAVSKGNQDRLVVISTLGRACCSHAVG